MSDRPDDIAADMDEKCLPSPEELQRMDDDAVRKVLPEKARKIWDQHPIGRTIEALHASECGERNAKRLCRALAEALAENAKLREALQDAAHWFAQFGYNRHGIAVKGDVPDPSAVHTMICQALCKGAPLEFNLEELAHEE